MMRSTSLTLLFILLCNIRVLHAQRFTVAVEKPSPVVYIGLDNWISCTVEKEPCDSVFLGTDNGEIMKVGCNSYNYRAVKEGDSKLIVFIKEKNGTRVIGEKPVRVRLIPDPATSIGSLSGGPIKKGYLLAQVGISSFTSPPLGIDMMFMVTEFHYTVIRNDSAHLFLKNNGPAFSPQIKASIEMLQKEDRILISNISVKKPDGRNVLVKPMEFRIGD